MINWVKKLFHKPKKEKKMKYHQCDCKHNEKCHIGRQTINHIHGNFICPFKKSIDEGEAEGRIYRGGFERSIKAVGKENVVFAEKDKPAAKGKNTDRMIIDEYVGRDE